MKEVNKANTTHEIDLAIELLRTGPSAPAFPWMGILRTHCETLSEMDPQMVTAISVTTPMKDDSVEEAEAVHRVARRMAEEFGFTSTVRLSDGSMSVRFARPDVDSAETIKGNRRFWGGRS